jgi:hypothetical protein
LQLRSPGKDSQGGFNIHLLSLVIPVSELGGDQQVVGVYATTSRRQARVLREKDGDSQGDDSKSLELGEWVQVARQGNPLFNEGLVAIADKDLYSRTSPSQTKSCSANTPKLPNSRTSSTRSFSAAATQRSKPIARHRPGIYIPT